MGWLSFLTDPFTLFGINFAPVHVSIKRRLETFAVMHYVFCWLILPLMSLWFPFYFIIYTPFYPVVIAYLIFCYFDGKTPAKGGRAVKMYQNSSIWTHFRDYFPIKFIKTADLNPEKNYIIGSHPHGVLSIGAYTNTLTGAGGFKREFPELHPTVLTLNGQFYFPFRREIGLAAGGCESSHSSLRYLLENPGKGRVITIVIGGAAEALDAKPGMYDLCLKSRRGFCKYALKYGADLVPMFNFGENDLYEQYGEGKNGALRAIQDLIKRTAGFCPPLFKGRGIFNYTFGILPHRRPITSVLGTPIAVKQTADPTSEEIDNLHAKYCKALYDLFEEHKHLHNIPEDTHLNIY